MGDIFKEQGVVVIAEAGVNHNGQIDLALQLIDAAKSAGADMVKFQSFTAKAITLPTAAKADYQLRTTPSEETQFEMLQRLELSKDDQRLLQQYAMKRDIGYLSTPFDRASLDFLANDLRLSSIKLPSSDLTNLPLLVDAARSSAQLIMSTGMATLGEVEMALKALAFGFTRPGVPSTRNDLDEAYLQPKAKKELAERVVLLHCTSDYPASIKDVNLRAMETMATAFSLPIGYSDHTQGTAVALAAVALGAIVIEKHLTLDQNMQGPDHAASCEPSEFSYLVQGIREVEVALGSSHKFPSPQELRNRATMRKGIFAARDLISGTVISESDIAVVRPETDGGSTLYYEWLGRLAPRDFRAGDPLIGRE